MYPLSLARTGSGSVRSSPQRQAPSLGQCYRKLYSGSMTSDDPRATPIDIALSFAAEQRSYVQLVNRCLVDAGVSVFYDENEAATLWGLNGTERFAEVYGRQAFRVVMFISEDYVSKGWPTIERRAALGRLIHNPTSDHILPVRFDDTQVPGLDPQRIFVRADQTGPIELASLILQHLVSCGRKGPELLEHEGQRTAQARLVSFTSMIQQVDSGTWTLHYRIENRSSAALDGVVVVVADPGAEDCRPEDQVGCAMELVIGVVGAGQLIEGDIEVHLTAEPAFVELPYLGFLIWTDIEDNHWMVSGAHLTRRAHRARTC